MNHRRWITSGVQEEIDTRQQRHLDWVLDRIRYYYRELHGTRACYRHPLSLKQLMKLTKRNSYAVVNAIRILANSISQTEQTPPVFYDRIGSTNNASHRPYRIHLRRR